MAKTGSGEDAPGCVLPQRAHSKASRFPKVSGTLFFGGHTPVPNSAPRAARERREPPETTAVILPSPISPGTVEAIALRRRRRLLQKREPPEQGGPCVDREDQARRRDDAIVRTENGSSLPSGSLGKMALTMMTQTEHLLDWSVRCKLHRRGRARFQSVGERMGQTMRCSRATVRGGRHC